MWLVLGGLFYSVTTQNLQKRIGATVDGHLMLDGSTFLATRYKVLNSSHTAGKDRQSSSLAAEETVSYDAFNPYNHA